MHARRSTVGSNRYRRAPTTSDFSAANRCSSSRCARCRSARRATFVRFAARRSGSGLRGSVNLLPETLRLTYQTRTPAGLSAYLRDAADANAAMMRPPRSGLTYCVGWAVLRFNGNGPPLQLLSARTRRRRSAGADALRLRRHLHDDRQLAGTAGSRCRVPARRGAHHPRRCARLEPRHAKSARRRRSNVRAPAVRATAVFVGEGHAQRVRRRKAAIRQARARLAVGGRRRFACSRSSPPIHSRRLASPTR